MKKAKIIFWRDASGLKDSGQNEWFTLQEAIDKAHSLWENHVETCGWIINKNKNFLIIASTKSDDVYSDCTMIPKSLIFKIEEVK